MFLQNLHKQLEEAIQDGEIWVMQLKDTEYELEGSRERVQQQATEILHKASKMCFFAFVFAAFGTRSAWNIKSSHIQELVCGCGETHSAATSTSGSVVFTWCAHVGGCHILEKGPMSFLPQEEMCTAISKIAQIAHATQTAASGLTVKILSCLNLSAEPASRLFKGREFRNFGA